MYTEVIYFLLNFCVQGNYLRQLCVNITYSLDMASAKSNFLFRFGNCATTAILKLDWTLELSALFHLQQQQTILYYDR